MKSWILLMLLGASPALAESLFVQTENGTVSIVKDLDARTCDVARLRALRLPATDEEKATDEKASKARWAEIDRWRAEHHCDEADKKRNAKYGFIGLGSPSTAGPSFVAEDGTCFVGADLGGMTIRQVLPSDARRAECLK